MGHVVRGHAMQRMVNSTLVNTAARAVPIGGMVGKVIVQAGSNLLSAAYSQDHELEADSFGLRLARAAGFDEAAGITMMRRLQSLGGDHPEDSLGAYFATHPPFAARIRHLKKAMR
jgi:putative metalloprotease